MVVVGNQGEFPAENILMEFLYSALMSKFAIVLHGMSYDNPMFIRIKLLYPDALGLSMDIQRHV